jgi:hypothetical protein
LTLVSKTLPDSNANHSPQNPILDEMPALEGGPVLRSIHSD